MNQHYIRTRGVWVKVNLSSYPTLGLMAYQCFQKIQLGGLQMEPKEIPDSNQTNKGMVFMDGIPNDMPSKSLVLG